MHHSLDMLHHMRTTINLPDGLAREVKLRAAAEGRTVTSLVEEGLRMVLGRSEERPVDEPLPAYGDPGARFLVDLHDREALWRALGEDRPR